MHILPQLRGKKYYGRTVMEYVQQPGEVRTSRPITELFTDLLQVLFLPNGMAHTIFNIDDNVALTENYLFPDTLPGLVRVIILVNPNTKWPSILRLCPQTTKLQ